MTNLPRTQANQDAAHTPESLWRLARVDVRSELAAGEKIVARVELLHRNRGRLTDLATGPGGIEAAFRAIRQLVDIPATLESVTVTGRTDRSESAWQVSACVTVTRGRVSVSGTSVGPDLLSACCRAYLNALLAAERLHRTVGRNGKL
jgi:2-isopropylmalate synthase